MSFACDRCGTLFASRQTLGGHLSYPTCVFDGNDSAVASSAETAEVAEANVNAGVVNNVTRAPVMSTLKLLE